MLFRSGGAACRYSNRTASRGLQDATLTGCALTRGASYKGFVYLEGPTPGITGTLLPAVPFTVLPSNDFAEGARPTLTNTPTTDGLQFYFAATAINGRAWAQIMPAITAASVTPAQVKTRDLATCSRDNVFISSATLYWTLVGCSLVPGLPYSLVVYAEDAADSDDGTLRIVPVAVPVGVSNYYTELPNAIAAATPDGVDIAFGAYAELGRAWAMVLEPGDSLPADIDRAKRAEASLGASTCKFAEVPIDNTRKQLSFSGCALARGTTYPSTSTSRTSGASTTASTTSSASLSQIGRAHV